MNCGYFRRRSAENHKGEHAAHFHPRGQATFCNHPHHSREMQNNREQLHDSVASHAFAWHLASQPEATRAGDTSMLRLSQTARAVTNSDGGVLLDLHHGKMFQMNAMGATVVELLANGSTEDRISLEISKRCGVEIAFVSADIHTFLASLKKYGLVDENQGI